MPAVQARADRLIPAWFARNSNRSQPCTRLHVVKFTGHPQPVGVYDEVWATGGHSHWVFPTSYAELLRLIGG